MSCEMYVTMMHTQEHDCKLTRDIVELIDREADLLVRGVSDESLRGKSPPLTHT